MIQYFRILSLCALGLLTACSNSSDKTNPISTPCQTTNILDDTSFNDTLPSEDIPWDNTATTVEDIASAFNKARAQDSTISQALIMPSQEIWNSMSIQERGLYLLNNERYYRGIKPYEGATQEVIDVATSYTQTLYDTDDFQHNADGTPWERLDRNEKINNNRDFFSYAENLYVHASSSGYLKNPIAKAIYGFIYDDSGSAWGHRNFCLANGLNDNSGESGVEGLLGFAVKQGQEYEYFGNSNYYSTIVVMNAFDPANTWESSRTIKTTFCSKDRKSVV